MLHSFTKQFLWSISACIGCRPRMLSHIADLVDFLCFMSFMIKWWNPFKMSQSCVFKLFHNSQPNYTVSKATFKKTPLINWCSWMRFWTCLLWFQSKSSFPFYKHWKFAVCIQMNITCRNGDYVVASILCVYLLNTIL